MGDTKTCQAQLPMYDTTFELPNQFWSVKLRYRGQNYTSSIPEIKKNYPTRAQALQVVHKYVTDPSRNLPRMFEWEHTVLGREVPSDLPTGKPCVYREEDGLISFDWDEIESISPEDGETVPDDVETNTIVTILVKPHTMEDGPGFNEQDLEEVRFMENYIDNFENSLDAQMSRVVQRFEEASASLKKLMQESFPIMAYNFRNF